MLFKIRRRGPGCAELWRLLRIVHECKERHTLLLGINSILFEALNAYRQGL